MLKKIYIILYVMILLVFSSFAYADDVCGYGISDRWTKGARILVYDYGKVENSRFFMPNIIKIYGGCDKDVLIHELAHYDNQKLNHDTFFWLSYYRIKMEVNGEI